MSAALTHLRPFAKAAVAPVFALLLIPSFLVMAWFGRPAVITFLCLLIPAGVVLMMREAKADTPAPATARTATLKPEELKDFAKQPEAIRTLLTYALSLTAKGLSYKPASHDPDSGGTDCSGFVYHVLQKHGYSAPRQSNEMYEWVWKAGTFRACNSLTTDTFEYADLRPGDLLFWTNTTQDGKTERNPPVTHVMIYLGERTAKAQRVCAGASEGRSYENQAMNGVSVFDFRLPSPGSTARFIGYAHLPGKEEKK